MTERTLRRARVLLLYHTMIPSVRLCGHCQLQELARRGEIDYRALQEDRATAADLSWADVVVLGRLHTWYAKQLFGRLRRAEKYLIYLLDDDLLNVPPTISSAPYLRQRTVRKRIGEMIGQSNAILSPSRRLLRQYVREGQRAIRLEEPALDPIPYVPKRADAPVNIGFAGSIDRTGDLEVLLSEALLRVRNTLGGRVRFAFFGAIPDFAARLDAQCLPYEPSYDAYRKKLNSLGWDIGLAPMPDTPFHACKHYNKLTEYAAAGIAGIYSRVEPYTGLPCPEAAVLCENTPEAWYEAIVQEVQDRELRERHRQAACRAAAGPLSLESSADHLLDEHASLFVRRSAEPSPVRGWLWLLKKRAVLHLIYEGAQRWGVRMPARALQHIRSRSARRLDP
ncbi:MAG: hypothetical protein IJ240_01540 [Clostridia bacterium]|nr:hypothetical protein [Clostridia bacterium]